MLRGIIGFSVRHAAVVAGLALAALGYGVANLGNAPYDVFPEFAPPQVTIQTEAPGLSPEQVEQLVTQPLENAVNGVSGIESLRSQSIQGLSVIRINFDLHSDVYRIRQLVAERLSAARSALPQGVQPAQISPLTSSTSIVLMLGLTSETKALLDLRSAADWTVKQRLLVAPGVAKVAVFGGEVRQLQIQIDPARLKRYNLSLAEVAEAARRATAVQGAGFIDTPNQRIVLQTEGQAPTADALAQSVLLRGTGENVELNIRLGDVATVAEAPEPRIGAAAIGGQAGVVLVVSSQFGANTRQVTGAIEAALDELEPLLKADGIALHRDLFRPAGFIDTAVGNITHDLLFGLGLVVAVLFVFLGHVRSALISAAAIPLSLVTAAAVLAWSGNTLNTMTLGGLAIAIGAVVDDAVINVENILRRLRLAGASAAAQPRLRVILDATVEVQGAVVFATVAVVLVFLPVVTLSGVGGRLFAPLALANIAAMLASFVVALTVTPALTVLLVNHGGEESGESRVAAWLKARYAALLEWVNRKPGPLLAGLGLLLLGSLAALPFFQRSFLPELREGHFVVHMSAVPGTSLDESLRLGRRVAQKLLALPFVRSVSQQAGRAERADDTWGTHYSELDVDLKPLSGEEAEQAQAALREALTGFAGVNSAVKTFLTERVEETISGYTAGGVLNIYGADLDAVDRLAGDILPILRALPGAVNVQLQSPPGMPQLTLRLKPEALSYWGLGAADVLAAIRVATEGETVAQVYRGNQVVDVSVVLSPAARASPLQIGDLPIKAPSGAIVKLAQVADIGMSSGRYVVLHDGARRVQTITFDVGGGDMAVFIAAARDKIGASVKFPSGSYIAFAGATEAQRRTQRDLLINSALAGLLIVALLGVVMDSGRNVLLLLLNLPFALLGGVLAVALTGGALSLGALVGFVTLFGISLRNSVMMMAHFRHLVFIERQPWGWPTAMRGASERLLPILMTALVTALGLLPLAMGSGEPGREIEGPMAVVILGGLVTSTLLNLLVLPALALRFGVFAPDTSKAIRVPVA